MIPKVVASEIGTVQTF